MQVEGFWFKSVHGKTLQSYLVEIHDDTNAVTIHPTNLVFEIVIATSGGFLYVKESRGTSKLSIMEPVSGKKLNLPPSPQPRAWLLFSGFAQDRSTGIYKVVRLYTVASDNFCFVLSLGAEHQWRPIDVRSFYCRSFKTVTICAGRYVYCATRSGSCYFDIITFDAETESICYFPTTYVKIGYDYTLLRMEDSLSLMSCNRNYKWKVWKFNISNPHVWERIYKIDLSEQRLLIERELSKGDVFIKPIAWLRNGELILFRFTYPSQCCIAYDVGKGDSFWFEFPDDGATGKSPQPFNNMKVKQQRPCRYVGPSTPQPLPPPPQMKSRPPLPPPSPPPPPIINDFDCALIASKKVEVSCHFSCSSVGGTTSFIACRNKKKKADDTTIFNIPRSLLHKIFLGIPALTLRSMTKRVCKEWNDIISDSVFVGDHSKLNPSGGFLVQKFVHGKTYPSQSYFAEIGYDTNAITIHPANLEFKTVIASSGGFLYIEECAPTPKFSILEPVSGKKLNLPPSPKPGASLMFSGFAQDRNTGIYKLVHFYSAPAGEGCFVLTLGVERQWRPIDDQHFRYYSNLKKKTISAGRYVYCATFLFCYFDIFTFDLETEEISYFPTTYVGNDISYYLLPMEDSLSLVVDCRNYIWGVWKFNNFNRPVWERILEIDLSALRLLIERELSKGHVSIEPIAWLRNGELILFRLTYPSQCCIAYDVRKEDSFWFEFPDDVNTGISAYFNINGIFSLNKP
ncbi:hypothetical protein ACET3Z_030878 [Daucus carota]